MARPKVTASEWLPLVFSPGASQAILDSSRVSAKVLASAMEGETRLAFARLFCSRIIETFWFTLQRDYAKPWPLPKQFLTRFGAKLEESAESLAMCMGEAAARLDTITASYLIGVTYTSMLPDDTRSRLGVYYTPPGLARRLLEMATKAGVDWRSCTVLDPACGGCAFLAPVGVKICSENQHLPPREVIRSSAERLRGFEIDLKTRLNDFVLGCGSKL